MTIYLTPLNDFAVDFPLEKFDATSGKDVPVTSGDVRAFIAASRSSVAVAVHATLDAIAAAYSAVTKMWSVEIDAAILTPALLRPLFVRYASDPFVDDFTRPDNAVTMGAPWVVQGAAQGAKWGIASNKAYPVLRDADLFRIAFVDWGHHDAQITATQGGGIASYALLVRYVDVDNYWYISVTTGGVFQIWYVEGGSTELYATTFYSPTVGDVMRVTCVGQTITGTILRDDAVVATVSTDDATELITATKFGLYADSDSTTFDDVRIESVEPPSPVLIITLPNGIRRTLPLEFRDSEDALVEV